MPNVRFEPTPENLLLARTACWESLRTMATADVNGQNRNGDWSMLDADNGLFARTALRLVQHGFDLRPNARPDNCPPVYRIVRETFMAAVAAGLIVPFPIMSQALDWNAGAGRFQFTEHGVLVLTGHDEPDIFADGGLRMVLLRLQAEGHGIDDGTIALLDEAQRCMIARCFRAAAVLVGLAAEDHALRLCDVTRARIEEPRDSELRDAWNSLSDEGNFARRWKGLLRLLEGLKRELRRLPGDQRDAWAGVLEPVPWGIGGIGEAIRMARNKAAHDSDHIFTNSEVTLLVKAVPAQLAALSRIERVLRTGVDIPRL